MNEELDMDEELDDMVAERNGRTEEEDVTFSDLMYYESCLDKKFYSNVWGNGITNAEVSSVLLNVISMVESMSERLPQTEKDYWRVERFLKMSEENKAKVEQFMEMVEKTPLFTFNLGEREKR